MQHLPQVSEHETRRSPLGCPNSHTNTVVLVGFWIVRSLLPSITPDVGALLHDPQTYLGAHPAQVTIWFAGLLGAAVGLGSLAAVPPKWSEKLFFSGRALARSHDCGVHNEQTSA